MTLTNGINSNGKLTQFGISANSYDPNTSINVVSSDILSETNNNDGNNYNINNNNNVEDDNEPSSAESDAVLLIDTKKSDAEDSEPLNSIDDNTDLENEMIRLSEEVNSNTDDKKTDDNNESAFSDDTSTLTASSVESEMSNSELDISSSSSSVSSTSSSPPPETELDEKQKLLNAINNATYLKLKINNQLKSLPWKPKVRLCELESFLDQERKKFLGYGDLLNDIDTLIGLPNPIHESVRILKQHLYVSLADEQIKQEEKIYKYPMSTQSLDEAGNDEAPAEVLFSSLLNNLPQYLVTPL